MPEIYQRRIEAQMDKYFKSHYSFTIYGARRVGKTMLIKEYAEKLGLKYKYVDCDILSNRQALGVQDDKALKSFIGDNKLILIDEAQRVNNIGLNMKIIHDHIPDVKVIATGSSALDLASEIKESMTGRDFDFHLFPLSLQELSQHQDIYALKNRIEEYMIYGTYPDVINMNDFEEKKIYLLKLANNYLYKDLLELDLVKKTSVLVDLLRVLAACIGSEVTSSGLSQKIGVSKETVDRYIDLLEQCFIIKRIRPYHKKVINEIKHAYKVYFWDLGIRNSLLEDFKNLDLRNDADLGGLWENFVFIERIKKAMNNGEYKNFYFWRTTEVPNKEYDIIEEVGGVISAYEIKWGQAGVSKVKKYPVFFENYPEATLNIISKDNFTDWLI